MADSTDAKNIANFQALISKVTAMGAPYNPSNADIGLGKLQGKRTDANATVDALNAAEAAEEAASLSLGED